MYEPKSEEARAALGHLCNHIYSPSEIKAVYEIPIEEEEIWLEEYYKRYPENRPQKITMVNAIPYIIIDCPLVETTDNEIRFIQTEWSGVLKDRIEIIKEEPKQETWRDRAIKEPML